MRSHLASILILAVALILIMAAFLPWAHPAAAGDDPALAAFAAIHPIDAHVHLFKSDAGFQNMLENLNLKVLNILVVDDTSPNRGDLQTQVTVALALMSSSHGHIAFCTTFDPYKFNDPNFSNDAVAQINRDFSNGAIAVKIWKNVGMEIKDRSGHYILADNPKFAPIYKDIAAHGKTLLTHQAEPDVAWGPPDPNDPSWSYYQENPQWYLGGKKGFPSKKTILAARDHVLQENPRLRVVGVHLGSMEKSLSDISARLDRYPNFAIDMAARMEYLMLMPRDQVRRFILKYQDRILYGTDIELMKDANASDELNEWRSTYARDWKYLATGEMVPVLKKQAQGLKLPEPVLRKIFHDNAVHWIPGL